MKDIPFVNSWRVAIDQDSNSWNVSFGDLCVCRYWVYNDLFYFDVGNAHHSCCSSLVSYPKFPLPFLFSFDFWFVIHLNPRKHLGHFFISQISLIQMFLWHKDWVPDNWLGKSHGLVFHDTFVNQVYWFTVLHLVYLDTTSFEFIWEKP